MATTRLPIKARPTMADIAAAVGELHDCLHAVASDVTEVKERVARVEGFQTGIASRLRVPAEGETISLWRRVKTPAAVVGSVFAGATAFVGFYPTLHAIILAVDTALMAHR